MRILDITKEKIISSFLKYKADKGQFREWSVKSHFSQKEIALTEALPKETDEDKAKIIEDAKNGDKISIICLVLENQNFLGKFFMTYIYPFASDTNEAFDDFMFEVITLVFDNSSDSVLSKFKPRFDVENPLTYFGMFINLKLRAVYNQKRKDKDRQGVQGYISAKDKEGLKNIEDFDSLRDYSVSEDDNTNDLKEAWLSFTKKGLPKKEETLKILQDLIVNLEQTDPISFIAEKYNLTNKEVEKIFLTFGSKLKEFDITQVDFQNLITKCGIDWLAKTMGYTGEIKQKEKDDRDMSKYEGKEMLGKEWVEEFLNTNPKGWKGTYKDFLKDPIYPYAMSKVTNKGFNSAKNRLKDQGKGPQS